jgi:hypothetical protein
MTPSILARSSGGRKWLGRAISSLDEEFGIRTLTRRSKKSVDLSLSGRGNSALAREILRFAQDDTEKPRTSF